jgi:hypothetical protein
MATAWSARGLLFENCTCQLLCPAHVSFKNRCDKDPCRGYWVVHVEDGRYGRVPLNDLNVVILYESPARMYSGEWTQGLHIDERATGPQRDALEAILSGRAGGPWEVLAGFVSKRLPTRPAAIRFEDAGRTKRLTIPGLFETSVTAIRGSDGVGEAVLSNLHNVIHGAVHVLARGQSRSVDAPLEFVTERTHALYSRFSWQGVA